jgi:4-amino-4-deoxy-L-arabinose transferase-like glycosyltransferase
MKETVGPIFLYFARKPRKIPFMLTTYRTEIRIALIAALLFIPFLGNVHLFDWDEINFAECAREMFINKDYGRVYINFLPFWEKPPFFIWLQVLSMHAFGIGDFAARFPNAVCGILTLVLVYRTGKRLYNPQFGILWALAFAGSVLSHLYFHSGIIDPWFNLLIFSALLYFISYFQQKEKIASEPGSSAVRLVFLSGLFLGLALITKGPAALAIFGLTVGIRWAFARFRFYFSLPEILVFLVGLSLFSLGWGLYEYLRNGPWFITEFITYNIRLFSTPDAGHGGFPGYHFVVLLLGCFPGSLFFIHQHFYGKSDTAEQKDFRLHMLILFWVVLILFSIVKSKIVHYSSMCYFPLTFGAALSMQSWIRSGDQISGWIRYSIAFIGFLLGSVVLAFPFLTLHPEKLKPLFSKDPFAMANLETQIRWDGWEWLVGVFVIAVTVTFLIYSGRKENQKALYSLFGGSALMVVLILWALIGRIEAFSQGTAIDFFESLAGKDCYVVTYNYRSYAQYYYPRLQPQNKPILKYPDKLSESLDFWRDSLLLNPVNKDVYVITKINRKEGLDRYPDLKLLWEKSGWSVWRKERNGN